MERMCNSTEKDIPNREVLNETFKRQKSKLHNITVGKCGYRTFGMSLNILHTIYTINKFLRPNQYRLFICNQKNNNKQADKYSILTFLLNFFSVVVTN